MSARERIKDATSLWSLGRKEGAYLMILIGVAATARKRYPLPIGDKEAFERFMQDEMNGVTMMPECGLTLQSKDTQQTPLETIMYKQFRCYLIHEGTMPPKVVFTPPFDENNKRQNIIQIGDPLGIPERWILRLADSVLFAPENIILENSV